ncbi:MAG TPA: sugar ABC transporter substrate-binding protein, partial [Dictyoglomaceae bacterium]|nr:sugar ABC transporter substrate-binding protein [Dictyoglomaceae bacterium]
DILPIELQYLKEVLLSGLVGQKYWGWGYDTIDMLYRKVTKGEKFPDWVDSGMDIVTKKNVDAMIRAMLLKDFKTPLPPAF